MQDAAAVIVAMAQEALAAAGRPVVIGLCGAQGSGKSTAAAFAAERLQAQGIVTGLLSLDDLYLGKAERVRLAATVHPLLRTRGVPGTHDVALGLDLFDRIDSGEAPPLPRFDKTIDDGMPVAAWPAVPAGIRVLLFEGWCVGATPQSAATLDEPVNALEAAEDRDGRWRRYVNDQLAGPYQALFARIDRLLLLRAPNFGVVRGWRTEQEHALRRTHGGGMNDAEIDRFVQHYERLTRHVMAEMPGRADRTIHLNPYRTITNII